MGHRWRREALPMSLDGLPFRLTGSAHFFEKASAPMGKRRRVGGIVSTERRDRQGEVVRQDGLDFSEYESGGWINDNHQKETDAIVGFPDGQVQRFRKGQALPNGMPAPADCHWHEGYLLEGDERADRLWKKALALQGTGRSLGWSIEGRVLRREGPDRKTIANAAVKHVALTAVPVNTDTQLDILAKSMRIAEEAPEAAWLDLLEKALSMGPATGPAAPVGPVTGEGAGQIVTGQSLEHDERDPKKRKRKRMSKAEALGWVLDRYPHISTSTAAWIVDLTLARRIRASGGAV